MIRTHPSDALALTRAFRAGGAAGLVTARNLVNQVRRRAGVVAQGPGTTAANIAVPITLIINGQRHQLSVEPRVTLLDAIEAHDIRTRQAGKMTFIDFHLVVPGTMSVDAAHAICVRPREQRGAVREADDRRRAPVEVVGEHQDLRLPVGDPLHPVPPAARREARQPHRRRHQRQAQPRLRVHLRRLPPATMRYS